MKNLKVLLVVLIVLFRLNMFSQDLFIYTSSYGYSLLQGDTLEVNFDFGNNGSSVNIDYKIAVAVKNTATGTIYTIINSPASVSGVSIPHNYGVDYEYRSKFYLPSHSPSIPVGNYEVIIAVDNDEEVNEISENNNAYILLGSINYYNTTIVIESPKLSIEIYPNPSTDFIKILGVDKNKTFDYKLMDVNGKIVKEELSKINETIEVSNLTKGVYLITIIQDSFVVTKRVLIE